MKYYHISLKHTHPEDEIFCFWRPNNSGYTYLLDEAGIYDQDITNLSEGILSISIKDIEDIAVYITEKKTKRKFKVCPNRSQYRKLFGFNIFEFKRISHKHERNDYLMRDYTFFDIPNTYIEKCKRVRNGFKVEMKSNNLVDEHFYYNDVFITDSRNKAISLARREWFMDDLGYLSFKKIVSVKINKETVFDGWLKI